MDRFRKKKTSPTPTPHPGTSEIVPGQGEFRIEVLKFKVKNGRVRKSWSKVTSVPVTEDTLDLARVDGYNYIAPGEWAKVIEVAPKDFFDGAFVRLRYFPNPSSMSGSRVLWVIYVEVSEDGDVSIDPDPEVPSASEISRMISPQQNAPQPQIQYQAPMNPQNGMANGMGMFMNPQQLQQFTQMMSAYAQAYNQLKDQIASAFGINTNTGSNSSKDEFETLEEFLRKLDRYEQFKKRFGGGNDIEAEAMKKMPWWASFLGMMFKNITPMLFSGGLQRMMVPGPQNPGYYPSQQQYRVNPPAPPGQRTPNTQAPPAPPVPQSNRQNQYSTPQAPRPPAPPTKQQQQYPVNNHPTPKDDVKVEPRYSRPEPPQSTPQSPPEKTLREKGIPPEYDVSPEELEKELKKYEKIIH